MTIPLWVLAEDKIRSGQHLGTGSGTLPHYPRGPTDATQHFWWKYQHRFSGRVTQTPVVDHRLLTHTIDLVIHRSIACPGLMEWQVWPPKRFYSPFQDPQTYLVRVASGTAEEQSGGPWTPSKITETTALILCVPPHTLGCKNKRREKGKQDPLIYLPREKFFAHSRYHRKSIQGTDREDNTVRICTLPPCGTTAGVFRRLTAER